MTDPAPGKRPATPPPAGGAGPGRRQGLLAAAVVLAVAGGIGWFAWQSPPRHGDRDSSATSARAQAQPEARNASAATDPARMTRHPLTPRPREAAPGPDDLAAHVPAGAPAPGMGEVIEGLHRAGIRSGLGAFNPPGTSPPLVGLAVPDDYVLPEGYVRHFQATDDGQSIEPILMYSPDYDFLDAAGRPVAIPADRVVRAANAPPGLPIRQVRIPPPQPAPGSSS